MIKLFILTGKRHKILGALQDVEILKFLLAKCDDLTLDTQGQNGTTPLHEAIRGDSQAIAYLLANGTRTDIADDDGYTAEQCAEMHHISLSRR